MMLAVRLVLRQDHRRQRRERGGNTIMDLLITMTAKKDHQKKVGAQDHRPPRHVTLGGVVVKEDQRLPLRKKASNPRTPSMLHQNIMRHPRIQVN